MSIINTSSLVGKTKLFIEISSKRKLLMWVVEEWKARALSGRTFRLNIMQEKN